MTDLSLPIYNNAEAARAHLESVQWPHGPVCPHCGSLDRITKLAGKSTRPGVYKCKDCRKPFSVTVGTLFERSHIQLHKWLLAVHLLTCSKKGISSHQLHRMLGVTYKTAWFMAHRIREAMIDNDASPLGGEGKTVEADETYFGGKQHVVSKKTGKIVGRQGPGGKAKVVALVERGGKARSFKVEKVNAPTISKILLENASRKSALMTDEAGVYPSIGLHFASHETVMHSADEYVRGKAHTNTIEGFFSIFKRGMRGIYQHCGEQHLARYLTEFDFRYSNRVALGINDDVRAERALKGIVGRRLTYRRTGRGESLTA